MRSHSRDTCSSDAARAGKEVEGCNLFEVDVSLQHINDVLLGKVGVVRVLNVGAC